MVLCQPIPAGRRDCRGYSGPPANDYGDFCDFREDFQHADLEYICRVSCHDESAERRSRLRRQDMLQVDCAQARRILQLLGALPPAFWRRRQVQVRTRRLDLPCQGQDTFLQSSDLSAQEQRRRSFRGESMDLGWRVPVLGRTGTPWV